MKIIEIANKADGLIARYGTRDPFELANDLDIDIVYCDFKRQRGAYKVIQGSRFIYINQNLSPVGRRIVLLHELGHDALHRAEAAKTGGFKEFSVFDMRGSRMEYEANIFAVQLEIDDKEFLDYCEQGYDVQQIASMTGSDTNLIAMKADVMLARGYRLRRQEHSSDFLRYDKESVK